MDQIYYGKIIIKKEVMVKPFQFNYKVSNIPVTTCAVKLDDNDIVIYSLNADSKAVIQSVVAKTKSARADLFTIIENLQITIAYPDAVIKETESILQRPGIDDPTIQNMTNLPFVTIDNEGSRDLDQAIYIEKRDFGYCIYYALADCGYYIRPGSQLFNEGLERGATYYFPEFSVPMLPPQLSEGVISLNPDVERRAFIFIIDLSDTATVLGYFCVQGKIRSQAQLTYSQVQDYYDNPTSSDLQNKNFTVVLDLLKESGKLMMETAHKAGRIHFSRKETAIGLTDDGCDFTISIEKRNDCSRYNEQISVLCNSVGAQMLSKTEDPDVQGIYRLHKGPGDEELTELNSTIAEILQGHQITDKNYFWDMTCETLANYIDRLYTLSGHQYVVDAIERQVMLTMRRSLFTDRAGEHYALSVNPYSRFSSPMREIVGVFTHKEALENLGLLKPLPIGYDNELRNLVIEAGNRSKNKQRVIERVIIKCAIDRFFAEELEKPLSLRTRCNATILGIKSTRLYVYLDDPPVELKVYIEYLQNYLQQDLEYVSHKIINKDTKEVVFVPGDRIVLVVSEYKNEKWCLVPIK